ncbi:hypothetical protein D3C81_1453620 [compost metagenome]
MLRLPVPIYPPNDVTVAPHDAGSVGIRIGNVSPSRSQIVPVVSSGSLLIACQIVLSGEARVPSFESLPVDEETYWFCRLGAACSAAYNPSGLA